MTYRQTIATLSAPHRARWLHPDRATPSGSPTSACGSGRVLGIVRPRPARRRVRRAAARPRPDLARSNRSPTAPPCSPRRATSATSPTRVRASSGTPRAWTTWPTTSRPRRRPTGRCASSARRCRWPAGSSRWPTPSTTSPAGATTRRRSQAANERIHLGLGYQYDPEVVEALAVATSDTTVGRVEEREPVCALASGAPPHPPERSRGSPDARRLHRCVGIVRVHRQPPGPRHPERAAGVRAVDGRPRGGPGRHRPRAAAPTSPRSSRPTRSASWARSAWPGSAPGCPSCSRCWPRAGRSRSRPTRAPSRPPRVRATTGDAVYVDDWAKPELLLAIAPFEVFVGHAHAPPRWPTSSAACGCRGWSSSSRRPQVATTRRTRCSGRCSPPRPTRSPTSPVRSSRPACGSRRRGDELGDAAAAVVRVAEEHPDDIGLVVLLLMHHRVLQPGEYIDVAAGVLHSYVRGLGIEVLANSDNVVRAGPDEQGGQRARAAAHRRPARRRRGRPGPGRRARARGLRQRLRPVPAAPGDPRAHPARRAPAPHRLLPARPGHPDVGHAAPSSSATSSRPSCRRARARSTSRASARSTSSPCPRPDPPAGRHARRAPRPVPGRPWRA